jgi:hypothetical protein
MKAALSLWCLFALQVTEVHDASQQAATVLPTIRLGLGFNFLPDPQSISFTPLLLPAHLPDFTSWHLFGEVGAGVGQTNPCTNPNQATNETARRRHRSGIITQFRVCLD